MTTTEQSTRRRGPALLFLIPVVVIAALALWGLVVLWDAEANTLRFELGKALLQLLLVVLAGAVVKFLADEHVRVRSDEAQRVVAREAVEQQRRESLRGLLTRATEAYQSVKRARRLLRAGLVLGPDDDRRVGEKAYDEQLALVSDAQLEFELLRTETETEGSVATEQGGLDLPADTCSALAKDFGTLEKYLSGLVTEYETHRPTSRDGALPLDGLRELSDFLARGGSEFKGEVARAFRQARQRIREAVLRAPQRAPERGSGGS